MNASVENQANVCAATTSVEGRLDKVEIEAGTLHDRIEGEDNTQKEKEVAKPGDNEEATTNDERRSDAFLRLLNTNVRMWHLLELHHDDIQGEEPVEDNTGWQELTGYQGLRRIREDANISDNERKTRLSMELHPDVLLSQFL